MYTAIAALSVAIEDPRDAELLRWIENQISDLPVDVIADAKTASIAVTIEPIVEGFVVSVADQRTGQTVVRELRSDKKDRRSRVSALREAVALSIRGTLQALAMTSSERTQPAIDPPTSSDRDEREGRHVDSREREPLDVPAEAARSDGTGLPFYASIGWRASAAAGDLAIDQGLTARGGLIVGSLELGAELSLGLPLALTDDFTRIELTRHRALVTLGYTFTELGALRLIASLAAGASIAHRNTSPRAAGVAVREPTTTAGALAALETRARIGRPVALELCLGADFIPGAPIFEYARSGAEMERARMWIVQPKIGAAIFFSSP